MASSLSRRSLLGGLLSTGAVVAVPASNAHAFRIARVRPRNLTGLDDGGLDIGSLTDSSPLSTLSSPPQPDLFYDRFSAIAFMPARTVNYTSVPGGIQHSGTTSEVFICPIAPADGIVLKEYEVYVDTGPTAGAAILLVRFGSDGTVGLLSSKAVAIAAGVQTVTVAVDHVVDIVNYDYELWVSFHNAGTLRGARIGSAWPSNFIFPAGLITVPQVRKLDTRSGPKPVLNSITTVELAPEVMAGASAALVNLTATNTVNGGYVTAFPGSSALPPDTSVLNWTVSNTDIANSAVVELGGGTSIKLFVGGSPGTATHLLCDLIGFFI